MKQIEKMAKKELLKEYVRIIEKYVDITTMDLDGIITSASDSFILKTGYSKKQLIGKYSNVLWHRDMDKSIEEAIWKKLKNGNSWEGELKIRTRSGAVYWADMAISPLYDARGRRIGYSAVRKDITAQKQCEILSAIDGLTGLLNRREFNEILPREVSRAKRKGERLCLAVLDIDNFKKYNDIYGHPAGDKVLKRVSRAMRRVFKRADEFCFRIGGEEFALLFYSDSEPVTLEQLKKTQDSISKLNIPHKGNAGINRVTVSMGAVSLVPDKKYESATLYESADALMYEVKEESKNNLKLRYCVTDTMRPRR